MYKIFFDINSDGDFRYDKPDDWTIVFDDEGGHCCYVKFEKTPEKALDSLRTFIQKIILTIKGRDYVIENFKETFDNFFNALDLQRKRCIDVLTTKKQIGQSFDRGNQCYEISIDAIENTDYSSCDDILEKYINALKVIDDLKAQFNINVEYEIYEDYNEGSSKK